MPAYDTRFDPPAPVAEVILTHPVADLISEPLRGKLDTGADLSVIPQQAVVALSLSPKGHVWARGYDGTYAQRVVYYVKMTVEGHDVGVVRCIAMDRRNVLLGRNVINRFILTLDGQQLQFELRQF